MDFQTQKMHMKVLRYDQSLNPIATIAVVDVPFKFDAISVFPPILQCHVDCGRSFNLDVQLRLYL